MLIIPGWAFLAVSGLWRRFDALQRWFLAIGVSIAFYPILFYYARIILPNLMIGKTKLILLLILMMGLIIWFMRRSWRDQFQIGKWGALVLAVSLSCMDRFSAPHLDNEHCCHNRKAPIRFNALCTHVIGSIPFRFIFSNWLTAVISRYSSTYCFTVDVTSIKRLMCNRCLFDLGQKGVKARWIGWYGGCRLV